MRSASSQFFRAGGAIIPIRQNDRFVLSIPLNEWALGAAATKLG
jgi:hypothetical protein